MEVSLVVRASAQEITAMLDLLAERGYIPQQWGREVIDPLPELEGLPPEFQLTPLEQAIVQHDLAGLRRQDISHKLDITPGTITVYRRLIRHKLRHLPPEQRPSQIMSWLRRFPGKKESY
ncbi:MAG TPA: LuxR C-terminal-related transcriptional regulator [Roseiflexaceae bacterium]|nr:LuxR C-terminal-related transcriptional regulator [Roseiflexaceae bacterium]